MKNTGPSCLRYSFVFHPEYWLWFVCPLRTLPNNSLSYFLFLLTGRSPYFRFGVPANHLASLFLPLVSGDLRLLSTNICWYPLCDLHSFLTVTFLTGCHCSFQWEDSINLISIVSVGYHVTRDTGSNMVWATIQHINLWRLFNAKAILVEEQQWYYLNYSWKDKVVHTFPKGICLKLNIIALLEFELAYYDVAVWHISHYTVGV